MEYENLEAPAGVTENMGGTTARILFASIGDFASIQKPVASPATLDEIVEIATAHTFNTGLGFLTGYCTEDKGKLDLKGQGERDGRSFKQEGEFFYPGSAKMAHGLASQAKNDKFILLVEMPDSDVAGYLQVGTEKFPASIDPEFTTGTNSSGVRGYIFKFSAMTDKQYIYDATVTLKP